MACWTSGVRLNLSALQPSDTAFMSAYRERISVLCFMPVKYLCVYLEGLLGPLQVIHMHTGMVRACKMHTYAIK